MGRICLICVVAGALFLGSDGRKGYQTQDDLNMDWLLAIQKVNGFKTDLKSGVSTTAKNLMLSKFEWKPCDDQKGMVVKIRDLRIQPDPILIPGSPNLTLGIDFTKPLPPPVKSEVELLLHYKTEWIDVCSYTRDLCDIADMCKMLDRIKDCPKMLVSQGFNCKCPVKPGYYHVDDLIYNAQELIVPVSGDFNMTWTLGNNGELGCYKINFSIKRVNN